MNRIIICFIALISIISCKKDNSPRKTVTIAIETFKMDSTSIRAIEILQNASLAFAGSKGDLVNITKAGKIKSMKQLKLDSIIPQFRAIASTKQAIFALSIGNPALLYKIENEQVSLVYSEFHENVFYDSMKFFDELNGIAMGDPINDCLSIIITRDGGNTWYKVSCNSLPKIEVGEAAFAASNTNIAIIDKNAWIVTGGLKSRVFLTTDMGYTWKVYNTPIIQGENSTGIYSVDFFNKKQGIICGGDFTDKYGNYANKAITNDGGKTWEIVAENKAPKYISCVQYVPNSGGKEIFAVSTNGIFYSYNEGVNWQKLSNESFYTIKFESKNVAWLSGNNRIAKMKIN
jgi:photosystem II stability/assembly factor-like uncharacterized protein